MTCEDFWNQMPELPGGVVAADHLRECASCASLLERHRSMAGGLKQIAHDRDIPQAPAALESRLVEAFRKQAGRRPLSVRRYWLPLAAAAAVLVAISFSLVRGHQPRTAESAQTQLQIAAADANAFDSDFVRLPYSAELEPSEDSDLVRVEMSRSALVALGVPVPMEAGAGKVEAVVALGPDGMLQGIRVLQ